jgi:hypothetical protein
MTVNCLTPDKMIQRQYVWVVCVGVKNYTHLLSRSAHVVIL